MKFASALGHDSCFWCACPEPHLGLLTLECRGFRKAGRAAGLTWLEMGNHQE